MGKLIPHSVLRRKRREKKYGTDASRIRHLKAMGYPMGYWDDVESETTEVDRLLYGETEEDEDFWLGEDNLLKKIR